MIVSHYRMINLAHAVLHDVTSFTLLLLEVWFGDQNAIFLLTIENHRLSQENLFPLEYDICLELK